MWILDMTVPALQSTREIKSFLVNMQAQQSKIESLYYLA